MFQGITPTPDPGFVRKLKRFDPKLKLEFSRKMGKFVITQPNRLHSGRSVAAVVEGNWGGGYRQPDDRDLAVLARADFERKSHKARIREGEEHATRVRERQDAHAHDEIMHATRDNKEQLKHLYRQIDGGDKVNSAFRRVPTKKKGYTVSDKRRVA